MVVETLLNNRFVINDTGIKTLGDGGMAVVYAGLDTETELPIAAKTLLPKYQGDSHRRARFRREAEILKAAQHPYVVELVDVVDNRRGTWIIMEQLQGETLGTMLEDEDREPFNPKTVNRWLAQVSGALEHMHQLGYVHLDVKPQNIFITEDGDAKLIDFGIAQKAYTPPARDGDKLLGTAVYISPEHGSNRVVTPQSDIYSLGCVVFELLTGKKVFSERGNISSDATVAIRQSGVPELPTSVAPELNLPAWADTVISQAILPNAEERYPSVTAFAEEFNAHANPPLLRLSWPNRRKQEVAPVAVVAPQETSQVETTAPVHSEPREPSRAGKWVRKEFRNARRALVVFALLVSLIFAAPMLGGSIAFDWLLGAIPGSTTEVVDGNWYMRAGPTTESEIRTLMQQDQNVRVTGTPVIANGEMWWPVSTDVDGNRVNGWAHDDGLQRTWLMNRAAGFELMQDTWSDRWDTATGWLPG